MKKILFLLLVITSIFIVDIACSNANASKLDVVNGVAPMDVHNIEWRKAFIEKLRLLPPDERKVEVDKELPKLNSQLVASLRERGYSCEIVSISYQFGSGKAKSVESGDGNTYDGHFDDQLYVVIKGGNCFKDSLMVFVQCFNGTFIIDGKSIFSLGEYTAPKFTIEKGKGINNYTDVRTTLMLAEKFDIPLYEGPYWNPEKKISLERARHLYETDSISIVQVTARVSPGDIFDLGNMTYNGQPAKN